MKIKLLRKRYVAVIAVAILSVIFLSILLKAGSFGNWQAMLADNLYDERAASPDIVLVAIDDSSLQEIGRWPWNRSVFAEAVLELENASVVAVDVGFFEPAEGDNELSEAIKKTGNVVLASEIVSFETVDGALKAKQVRTPTSEIEKTYYKTGYVNIITDADGITRRIPTKIGAMTSLPEAIVSGFLHTNFSVPEREMLVNFGGPPGRFATISFSDLGATPDYKLKNKIVIIGATANSLHDNYFVPTSLGKAMPGIEIHANAVETIMAKKYLYAQKFEETALVMLVLSVIVALAFLYLDLKKAMAISFLLIPLYWAFAVISAKSGVIMNLIYPPMAIALSTLCIVSVNYAYERQKKKEVLDTFGRYVSKDVVDTIFHGEEAIDLKGVDKNVTVLFADIRGFTSLSERMTPHEVVEVLNAYLGRLTDVIFENKGTLDKYMGDAIMALFNAPLNVEDHEEKACKAALEMQKAVKELNRKIAGKEAAKEVPELRIGIGINTGHAIVGNVGSRTRVEYTAIGDMVNTASRIEGLTKQYGVSITIGEETYKKVKNKFYTRELDFVRVKGKNEPVRIYELRAEPCPRKWDSALSLYRKARFREAGRIFKEVGDGPGMVFAERCKELSNKKLPKNWDGVFTHTVK